MDVYDEHTQSFYDQKDVLHPVFAVQDFVPVQEQVDRLTNGWNVSSEVPKSDDFQIVYFWNVFEGNQARKHSYTVK